MIGDYGYDDPPLKPKRKIKPKPKKAARKKAATPAPVGRPSKYDPLMCKEVIAWGKEGKSRVYMCAMLGIDPQTMINWERAHPEFFDALGKALRLSQTWWEDIGQKGMQGKSIDASIWSRSMAARFPNDWREKTHVTVEQPDTSHLNLEEIETMLAIMGKITAPKQG
jgi:hypothetical protein